MISFFVAGAPHGKERARSAKVKNGKTIHYTPKKTVSYEKQVAMQAKAAMDGQKPFDGPVRINFIAVFPIPVAWPLWKREAAKNGVVYPTVKPDSDNIEKSIKDGCNKIVWIDDSYAVSGSKDKIYANDELDVGVHVFIQPMKGLPAQIKKKPEGL